MIVLSLAPMVASTVANGPSSPWDAISLIITLRIWRVKRIIDGKQTSLHTTCLAYFSHCYFMALLSSFFFNLPKSSFIQLCSGNGQMDSIKYVNVIGSCMG